MTWFERCESEAKALTVEQRQDVLDTIFTGASNGEAMTKHGLTLAAVCGVINLNISEAKLLNRESV